ncbi:MAG: hypothetical protein FWD94_06685 [Treponema sp.]|nr:hypothetical protein [Treponema sp.]
MHGGVADFRAGILTPPDKTGSLIPMSDTPSPQQATSNKQQATSNKQQATSNKQQAIMHIN